MGRDLVRHRLLTMVGQTPGLWLVEACAGSGKSHFARQIASHYSCAVVRTVPIATAHTDPAPIIVDPDGPLWDPSADEFAALLSRPDDALTVVTTRRVGRSGVDVGSQLGARWLRTPDLWFDDDELAEIATLAVGDETAPRLAKTLRSLTDAWPAAVGACLDEAEGSGTDVDAAARDAIRSVLGPVVDRLYAGQAQQLEVLSFFERFDEQMAVILEQPGLLDGLLAAGVPLVSDGRWFSLSPVARGIIRDGVQDLPSVDDKLFSHLVSNNRLIEAIEAAAALSNDAAAAHLLAQPGVDDAYALDAVRTSAVAERLGSALANEPRVHLVRARQHLSHGDLTNTIGALRAGVEATAGSPPGTSVVEELQAELSYALYLSGDLEAARSELSEHDFEFAAARARQYQVIAGLDALSMERTALDRAAENYRLAERLWSESGEALTASAVLTGLAMEVTSRLGRLNEAIALIERALATAAAHPIRHAATQLIRVRLLVLAGRHGEATDHLRDVEGLLGIVLRGWMAAHAHQARALMASHRGDHAETVRQIELAQGHLGDLIGHAPGATLHCDAVDVFARTGDVKRAEEHLQALRSHPGTEPPDLLWAEIVFACRVGDAGRGRELVNDFRGGELAVPGGDWKLDFVESIAATRLEQRTDSAALMARAHQGSVAVGTPDVIDKTELGEVDRPAPSNVSKRCHIEVLGDFRVTVDRTEVGPPLGHAGTLLKLLVLHSGQMTVDDMTALLWPNGDPTLGRRRIRNVLSRLRNTCGDVVARDGELLKLADDVTCDFTAWWEGSVSALGASHTELSHLRELADQAPGVLLPADRYEEWLQPLQQRYQLQLLRLLDAVTAAASEVSIDLAIDAQRRGLEIEPWSSERIQGAIDLSRDAGRPADVEAFELLLAEVG